MSAATVSPTFSCISRTASAVITDVMCCPPIEILTCAIKPLVLISIDTPHELIAAADAAEAQASFAHWEASGHFVQKLIEFRLRNAVMPSRRLHGTKLFLVDPYLQC